MGANKGLTTTAGCYEDFGICIPYRHLSMIAVFCKLVSSIHLLFRFCPCAIGN